MNSLVPTLSPTFIPSGYTPLSPEPTKGGLSLATAPPTEQPSPQPSKNVWGGDAHIDTLHPTLNPTANPTNFGWGGDSYNADSKDAEQYKVSNSMLSEKNSSPIAYVNIMASIMVGLIITALLK